jgi:phosphoribosylamine--glycine ligase
MLLDQKFGKASSKVVIEEFLSGIELSCFVLTDGTNYVTFPLAKDYKRIGEGDSGLNTGGMGAVSPVPFADEKFCKAIQETIVRPTIDGLKKDNIPYVGFVFIGLIRVGDAPYVIEYNVRMGDPETQVVLPRIKNDLAEMLYATAKGKLEEIELLIEDQSAITVVAVSGGYPEAYEKGKIINGVAFSPNSTLFHAGTTLKEGKILTNGGRVLAVTSFGENHKDARLQSYKLLEEISFEGMHFRKDIGFDL